MLLEHRDNPSPEEMSVKSTRAENTQSFLFHFLYTDLVTFHCGLLLAKHGSIFKINKLILYKIHQKKTLNSTCGVETLSLLLRLILKTESRKYDDITM